MSAAGFQSANFVGGNGEPFQFPLNADFNFVNPLQEGAMLGAASHDAMWGGGGYPTFDPLSQPLGGDGQMSLVQEPNNPTLQVGPLGIAGNPSVLPGQVGNHHGAPYAFTEGQLLPVNSGFRVNPALPGPAEGSVTGGGPAHMGNAQPATGNAQPVQPGPIFDHGEVVARLAAAEAKMREIESQLSVGRRGKQGSVHLEPSIRDEVHKTCTDLIGCFEKVRLTEDPDEPPYYDLPEPLPAGTPERTGPENTGILFNPWWEEKVTSAYNNRYIEAVVNVMMTTKQHLLDPAKHTRSVIKAAAQEYLCSLKRARGFRLDAAGRARLERRRQIARRWNRRRAKAYELRKASIVLRKVVGHAQSVGLDSLVDTDWVSSEHSDVAGSLEIRPVEWHSQKLRDLYASLRTIRAALPKGKTLDGVSPVAYPQDDGKDFTDEQRIEFLHIVSANIELRKLRAAGQRKWFIGSGDNRMRTKAVAGRIIHQDCVNEEWVTAHLSPDAAKAVQTPRPGHVTIWNAVLPKELVGAKIRE